MHRFWTLRLLAALTAAVGTAASASGAVVVRDSWLDGTRSDPAAPIYSENGVDVDLDGDIESVWYAGGAGTFDPAGTGGPLRGAGFGASSASWTTYFAPEAAPVTLATVGDSLKVTWAFTMTNVNTSNTSQGFRLALVDTPAASRLAANGTPASATYTGYGAFANIGQTLGNSNPFRLVERTNTGTAGAILSASADWTGIGTTGAPSGAPGYASGTLYTFQMTLTRGVGDVLEILMTMSGGTLNTSGLASVAFTDTTPNGGSFTFDTFSLRPSSNVLAADQFDTSLFMVEATIVPEPGSIAGILSALSLLRRRR